MGNCCTIRNNLPADRSADPKPEEDSFTRIQKSRDNPSELVEGLHQLWTMKRNVSPQNPDS